MDIALKLWDYFDKFGMLIDTDKIYLKKPTDLDLHCLLRQGMSCSAREGLITEHSLPMTPIVKSKQAKTDSKKTARIP